MSQENHSIVNRLICVCINVLKQWQIIFCVVLLCGIGMDLFKTYTYQPKYVASTTAVIESGKPVYGDDNTNQKYAATLDYIFETEVVNEYVKDKLKDAYYPYSCNIVNKENTNVVTISILSDTKQSSFYSLKYIMNWYHKNHKKYQLNYKLKVLDDISFSEMPMMLNSHSKNFIKGAMIGGILTAGILFIIHFIRNTVTTVKDIENNIDSRLFSKIPREKKSRGKKFWKKNRKAILVDSMKTSFGYKEALKKLRHRLEESCKKHGYKTILVTSTSENEGKSSICANLAIGLAMKNHKVLIIDADFRKPSLHKIFEISDKKYLNDYVNGKTDWKNLVISNKEHQIDVLITKKDLDHAEKYCEDLKMMNVITEARKVYDYVLIDSSPAGYLNDAIKLNKHCDCSLLITKQNTATFNQINNTIVRLTAIKNNLLGIVYNASILKLRNQTTGMSDRYGYNRYYDRNRRT